MQNTFNVFVTWKQILGKVQSTVRAHNICLHLLFVLVDFINSAYTAYI